MKKTGSQIVIECLVEQGVDTVFGYPGGAILNIYDELYKNEKRIRHILTAHEQGAAHAADGFARATGKVGVVMATSGPGATNLVTGIATAYMDSSPIVAITCNVPLPQLGRDSFQEIDIAGVTIPITKHNFIVRDVKDLAETIREAFFIAQNGRPGPVLIDIPKDVTSATCDFAPCKKNGDCIEKSSLLLRMKQKKFPSENEFMKVSKIINASEKPFIYCGGGVVLSNATDELKTFAEKANIPVSMSLMGKTAFPNSHELSVGMIGMHGSKASNMAASQCDVLLAIGTRFSDRVTGDSKKFAAKAKIIHIDIDPAEINKNVQADESLIGNIKDVLQTLLPLINKKPKSNWFWQIDSWKKEVPKNYHAKQFISPQFLYEYVNKKVGDDAIIATEVGQHQMWASQFYHFEKPRTFLTSGGLGTMGFGTGAAIGAKLAFPEKTVVHFAGDGSFRMNCNELATISHYKIPVIIIIVNNGTLGNVRQWQTLFYGKRYSQTTLDFAPDFVKLADAYGIKAARVSNETEFAKAFDTALSSREAYIIDAQVDIDAMILPMIPPGNGVEKLIMDVQ